MRLQFSETIRHTLQAVSEWSWQIIPKNQNNFTALRL